MTIQQAKQTTLNQILSVAQSCQLQLEVDLVERDRFIQRVYAEAAKPVILSILKNRRRNDTPAS
jgi:hypothetical protein